jgi:hypothetical protein
MVQCPRQPAMLGIKRTMQSVTHNVRRSWHNRVLRRKPILCKPNPQTAFDHAALEALPLHPPLPGRAGLGKDRSSALGDWGGAAGQIRPRSELVPSSG